MKNGILNNRANEDILNYNSSKNIEHDDMNLHDYIELTKNNLISENYRNLSNKAYFEFKDLNFEGSSYVNSELQGNPVFNNSRPIFEYNETNHRIKLIKCQPYGVVTHISAQCGCQPFVTGTKYLRIQIYRQGTPIALKAASATINANEIGMLNIEFMASLSEKDEISIEVYSTDSTSRDYFAKISCFIDGQLYFQNDISET